MKRSSRLIILVGILLAVAAFGGVIVLNQNASTSQAPPTPTTHVVIAKTDIGLGTAIDPAQLTTKDMLVTAAPQSGFTDPSQVIGRVVRQDVRQGEALTASDFASGMTAQGDDIVRALSPGYRAMAVITDRVSGVGTLIQAGDRVDAVVGFRIQEYLPAAKAGEVPQTFGDPQLTVKLLVQNLEVLGTMIVVPEAQAQQASSGGSGSSAAAGAVTSDQSEIVILAVTPQQAEVLKYVQVDGVPNAGSTVSLTLILRAPGDASAKPDDTTGITIRQLVDKYGVIPPLILESK